jgi:hypothetical protein
MSCSTKTGYEIVGLLLPYLSDFTTCFFAPLPIVGTSDEFELRLRVFAGRGDLLLI